MAIKPIQILINAKDNASAVFGSLQAKVAAVGAAIASYFGVQAFAGVVKGAADLESAMSRVKAATGATAEEMVALKKAAEDAGANTKFTSVEAAGALENLAKAGLSAGDSIAALPAVLHLAQAGDVGLAESAEFVTKAVMGMGLAFTDAGRVADVLALGANATNTSVSGLAQALSYVAPVAQSAGVSLEGTVAMAGKLADAGIDASRSGTAMANMLAQFSDPASAFKRALADAGITTNNFEQALHQLAEAGPRGEKAILAVGLNAGPALRALLNQGMPALDELKSKLEGAAGSAAAAAKVMEDNLNGSLSGLASAWDTVKNTLGTPVLPVIKEGVDQLAASLRGAVSDGTIQRFGESIATAFQNGLKWIKEFAGSIDFGALTAKLQAWADEAAATMTRVGEYATNAGNIVKTAWGVMTAGANSVMAIIYKIAEAFAGVSSNIQSGLALIMDGFAKVTFGDLSKSFKAAAEEIRLSAEATGAVSQAFADKAGAAFDAAADGARLAQDGFAGLTGGMRDAGQQAGATSAALASVATELQKTAEANAAAAAAQQKKAQADTDAKAAAESHAQALATLRAEYSALVASGSLQAAAEKLQQINQALRDTAAAGKDAAAAAQETAKQVEAAFTRLGVTSTQVLKDQASAAQRDYELIRESGLGTARDIQNAFKVAADAAIAANNGIAPSWVQAQAAVRGYVIETDGAGKSVVKLREEIERTASASGSASRDMQGHWGGVRDSVNAASQAVQEYNQRMKQLYGRPGEGGKGLFEEGRKSTRGEELGKGVEEIGTGGYQFRNKDGMTSDAKGNVQQQWVWTRASIIEYLEQAGLDKLLAEDLSRQFVQPNGTVNYTASAAQKQWGGKYGTLAEALGKMADYYKYGDGQHEAAQRQQYLQGAAAARTVNLNLNLGGGRSVSGGINTDADGAATLENLMSELERSRRNTGR